MEKRSNRNRQKSKRRRASGSNAKRRVFLGIIILAVVMLTGIGCGMLTAGMNTKPDLAKDILPPASSQIYDINGKEIANVHATENRRPVKLEQVPQNLQDAFVAVEDNRFYDHFGIDPRGIIRAVWNNLSDGEVSEGGSTITQQLAKNAYLTQERTLSRKVQEAFLALQLERQYTKQEILELYLNQIYFGQGAYGVQAAAKTYFGKNVEELDLNECAMLAGIPKSPNYYSPFNDLQAATDRKETVLDQMVNYGYISKEVAESTKKEPLKLVKSTQAAETQEASYFIDYVTQQLVDKYGADAVYKDGLKIYTTIDMDMQRAAEKAMQMLPDYEKDANGIMQPQGALVAIDPHTGYVKAMVGGRGTDQFNRATMAERQPGSSFKPFVFAAALENNFTPSTTVNDGPIKVGDWEPANYDRRFRGSVSLREVARDSLNVPTIKIAQKIGIDKPLYYAQEMGISTLVLEGAQNDRNLAAAIGGLTRGVTPLELTSAYGTFANNGVHVDPVVIVKILDRNGKVIEEASPAQKNVLSETSAAELTSMLKTVMESGTGAGAKIGRPAAGKTGTTDDSHDAWFVGYTPDLVAGVWVGSDDNTSLGGMTGGQLPARIWRAFMVSALESIPAKDFDGEITSKSDTVWSVEDDSSIALPYNAAKTENKADEKAEGKDGKQAEGKNSQASAGGTAAPASKESSVPQETPVESAPAPDVSAPERSGGGGKGR